MLIVDMPMPRCCDDCPMFYDGIACDVTGTKTYPNREYRILNNGQVFDSAKNRFDDCPIKGELVRCGECKQYEKFDGYCKKFGMLFPKDNPCINGERRDGK